MSEPQPGDVLLGKYRVEEVIGTGGMGRVLRASHLYLQQPVAIKMLLPQLLTSESTVARFLREAQATVRLRSEHIARVMDVGTMPDGTPFMVMELLEGHDLNQILRHHGPQQLGPVIDLMLQACEGIAEAHALGIVHRDIKPSNFFVTRRTDGSTLLKILDFGISKTPTELSELTGTQTVIGTPTYMAPEQMVSARATDPRSDIWSIGVVMYQLIEGRLPFEAESYAELVIKVSTTEPLPMHAPLPPSLQATVFRCLEKQPDLRIQHVGELARMLAPYATDPLAAQQSAQRTERILAGPRATPPASPRGDSTLGAGPYATPPVLTPRSWHHSNGSSVSAGAGQLDGAPPPPARRGVRIAGIATMCALAGVGGFVLALVTRSKPAPVGRAQADMTSPAAAVAQPTEMAGSAAAAAQPTVAPTGGSAAAAAQPASGSAAATAQPSAVPADGSDAAAAQPTVVTGAGSAGGAPTASSAAPDAGSASAAEGGGVTSASTMSSDVATKTTTQPSDASPGANPTDHTSQATASSSATKTTTTAKSTKSTKSNKTTKSTRTTTRSSSTRTSRSSRSNTSNTSNDDLFDGRK